MDYNTKREKLMMPEYGRSVQQMVQYCKGIDNRDERMRCAKAIVKIMGSISERTTTKEDFQKKLWNHLAAMAEYELDIDYPVEIERMDNQAMRAERLPYPQHNITMRNYGAIVEAFAKHLRDNEMNGKQKELSQLLANHMKRDLCNWSIDTMSDERVVEDLARFTDGKVVLDTNRTPLVGDGELLSNRISTTVKKRKRKG